MGHPRQHPGEIVAGEAPLKGPRHLLVPLLKSHEALLGFSETGRSACTCEWALMAIVPEPDISCACSQVRGCGRRTARP